MEDIDRIEVIRGPGGTIWGPNAVNGVINIITKRLQRHAGNAGFRGRRQRGAGLPELRATAAATAETSIIAFTARASRAGPKTIRTGGISTIGEPSRAAFAWTGTKTSATPSPCRAMSTTKRPARACRPPAIRRRTRRSWMPTRCSPAEMSWAAGNESSSDGNDIQIQAYYDRTNRHEPNFARDPQYIRRRFPAASSTCRRGSRFPGAWARASIRSTIPRLSRACTFVPNKRTDYLLTAFLQDEIGLVDHRLSLTLGTKLLRTNFTGFELEPSARLLWTPAEKQTVWAAFTHALRTPSDAEENFYLSGLRRHDRRTARRISRDSTPTRTLRRNSSMAMNWATAALLGQKLYVDVTGFYNHYHDLFSEEFAGRPFLETHAGARASSASGAVPQRPAGLHQGRGDRSRMETHALLAAARIVFVPAHESRKGAAFRRRGHGADHRRVQSAASGDGSIRLRSLEEAATGSRLIVMSARCRARLVPAYSTGDARFGWRFSRQFELSLGRTEPSATVACGIRGRSGPWSASGEALTRD